MHWALQASGLLTMLAGCGVIYKVKINNGKDHLTTWHGFLGALCLLWGLVQAVFGYLKSTSMARRWIKPVSSRILHAVSGGFFFAFACFVVGLGFRSDWFQQTALVNSFDDVGVRLLVGYILMFFLGVLAMVVLKQVNDKYLAPATTESKAEQKQQRGGSKQQKK